MFPSKEIHTRNDCRYSFLKYRRASAVWPWFPAPSPSSIRLAPVPDGSRSGLRAGFPDSEYVDKGVRIANSRAEVFQSADVVLQVRSPGANPETGAADLHCCVRGR